MRSRFPFTESQWEELEQQAQIFKYIISGLPVPHHLLFPIRKDSYFSIPTPSLKLFSSPSPQLSWNVYEMGMGRKIDTEPGRCRRTDGKKWRCSKEAYPDSKYCERHMHRGKNRSRKPVEFPSSSSSKSSSKSSIRPFSSSSSLSLSNNDSDLSSSLYSNGHLDCSGPFPSYMDESDPYRRSRYTREDGGGLFQMEPSGSIRGFSGLTVEEDSSWRFTPLKFNNPSPYIFKQTNVYDLEGKPEMPFSFMNHHEREGEEESSKKPVHKFFDEWPQEQREMPSNSSSVSTTLFI